MSEKNGKQITLRTSEPFTFPPGPDGHTAPVTHAPTSRYSVTPAPNGAFRVERRADGAVCWVGAAIVAFWFEEEV